MRIIAFCGPKGCGKDTAAKTLFEKNQSNYGKFFRHSPMAEGVKNVCEDFFGWDMYDMSRMDFKETPIPYWPGGPVLEPRWAMMDIANWLRDKYGGAIHAARWAMHAQNEDISVNIEGWTSHVTTDMRFPEEVGIFEQYGGVEFLPIYIERTEAEEILATKQASGDKMALNASESHYPFLREYCRLKGAIVQNNGGVHQLHNEVMQVVKNKFGHWSTWKVV